MTTMATAPHTPGCASAGQTCSEKRSFRLTASLAAVVEPSTTSARIPAESPTVTPRSRVQIANAIPIVKPAGSHARTTRKSGCAPRDASSSSGSAPDNFGPSASAPTSRSRYSHPTPAQRVTTDRNHPRALNGIQ